MKPQLKSVSRILMSLAVIGVIVRVLWVADEPSAVARLPSPMPATVSSVETPSRLLSGIPPVNTIKNWNDVGESFVTKASDQGVRSLEWGSRTVTNAGELAQTTTASNTFEQATWPAKTALDATNQPIEIEALSRHVDGLADGLTAKQNLKNVHENVPALAVKSTGHVANRFVANESKSWIRNEINPTVSKVALSPAEPKNDGSRPLLENDFTTKNDVESIQPELELPRVQGPASPFFPSQSTASTNDDFPLNSLGSDRAVPRVASITEPIIGLVGNRVIASQPTKGLTNPINVAPPENGPSTSASGTPSVLAGASSFVLAAQPKMGDHWAETRPLTDRRAVLTDTIQSDFSPDAVDQHLPYDPYHQMNVYEGKTLHANQRPLVELGRPWYQLGQFSPSSNILGKHNPVSPQFLVYGDYRSAFASNTQNANNVTQSAMELNLDFDLKLTSTERFHMFMAPLDNGVTNSGYLFDEDRFVSKFDANIDFGYFEGDLGAIVGGLTNKTLPFDFPFAIGVMPLVLQNGVWMEDAFLGVAATIPARNSARFNISNMDTTFFAGYDKITTPAFAGDDSAARMYGMASFIEALNGYIELDYAFLDDRTFENRSYHNLGIGYTRRYGRFVSNSTRMIINAGQQTDVVANTADGVLLLSENSLITGAPSTVVPYLNFFAGFDRPQSAARAAQAGGILRNTGILFESDGMTNYPTLDPTANDTIGGALGLNLLPDLAQQLVVEAAWLNVMGDDINRNAAGNQYGLGARYQLPLTNALIFRADAMIGFLDDDSDIHGVRMELRHKW